MIHSCMLILSFSNGLCNLNIHEYVRKSAKIQDFITRRVQTTASWDWLNRLVSHPHLTPPPRHPHKIFKSCARIKKTILWHLRSRTVPGSQGRFSSAYRTRTWTGRQSAESDLLDTGGKGERKLWRKGQQKSPPTTRFGIRSHDPSTASLSL